MYVCIHTHVRTLHTYANEPLTFVASQHHTDTLEAATITKWSQEQLFSFYAYHSLDAATPGGEQGGERKAFDGSLGASRGKLSGAGAVVLITLMVSNGKKGDVPAAHARCVLRLVSGDDFDQVVFLCVCVCCWHPLPPLTPNGGGWK
jgi:hypothetical protein